MKKIINTIFLFASLLVSFVSFAFVGIQTVQAQSGLVPCGYDDSPNVAEQCQFADLMKLAKNVMDYILYISIPIAAISFTWAGWLYLSAAGNEGNIKKAHEIFGYVVLGFCLVLAAWLIVNALVVGLGVLPTYNPLSGGAFGG